jgi:hypothetical protein
MSSMNIQQPSSRNQVFPFLLHDMLEATEKDGRQSVVSWLPHGRGFKVYNPEVFVREILCSFFNQTQYKSFQRQLNIYGFERIKYGPFKGAYIHELFIRGRPSLFSLMVRTKVKQTKGGGGSPSRPLPSSSIYPATNAASYYYSTTTTNAEFKPNGEDGSSTTRIFDHSGAETAVDSTNYRITTRPTRMTAGTTTTASADKKNEEMMQLLSSSPLRRRRAPVLATSTTTSSNTTSGILSKTTTTTADQTQQENEEEVWLCHRYYFRDEGPARTNQISSLPPSRWKSKTMGPKSVLIETVDDDEDDDDDDDDEDISIPTVQPSSPAKVAGGNSTSHDQGQDSSTTASCCIPKIRKGQDGSASSDGATRRKAVTFSATEINDEIIRLFLPLS